MPNKSKILATCLNGSLSQQCLRMLEKVKSVIASLEQKSGEIDNIYSDGVINGFTAVFWTQSLFSNWLTKQLCFLNVFDGFYLLVCIWIWGKRPNWKTSTQQPALCPLLRSGLIVLECTVPSVFKIQFHKLSIPPRAIETLNLEARARPLLPKADKVVKPNRKSARSQAAEAKAKAKSGAKAAPKQKAKAAAKAKS